ncbi:hypothetical protein J3F83DRAFT_546169 [Trichoderma novae-zelandiae]
MARLGASWDTITYDPTSGTLYSLHDVCLLPWRCSLRMRFRAEEKPAWDVQPDKVHYLEASIGKRGGQTDISPSGTMDVEAQWARDSPAKQLWEPVEAPWPANRTRTLDDQRPQRPGECTARARAKTCLTLLLQVQGRKKGDGRDIIIPKQSGIESTFFLRNEDPQSAIMADPKVQLSGMLETLAWVCAAPRIKTQTPAILPFLCFFLCPCVISPNSSACLI